MGADGFAWVLWGAGGMGSTKTRRTKRKLVVQGKIWALWPGKFPLTAWCAKKEKKTTQMSPGGCGWVQMGAKGCGGVEGQENEGERAPDGTV